MSAMEDLPELPTLAALENPVQPSAPKGLRPIVRVPEPEPVIVPIQEVADPPSAPLIHLPAPKLPDHEPVMQIQPWSSVSSTHEVVEVPVEPKPVTRTERLLSLDAYRGLIMLFMASSGLGIVELGKRFPNSVWATLAPNLEHVKWTGAAAWDIIQPAFMFMVGVAMPFSYAKRFGGGASSWDLFFHALGRALVLIALGVLCSSGAKDSTNWTFTNVLAQIGLGYVFLFLLWRMGTTAQVLGTLAILFGYGAWFASAPLMTPPASAYPEGILSGEFAHWSMNANVASAFDQWFLNLFPRAERFSVNEGGYTTLNFIPSIATMCLGLMAGRYLRTDKNQTAKVLTLVLAGAALTMLGVALGESTCPIVKRIWTPSWVLYSGGIVTLVLAVFYGVIEGLRARWLAWPLAIVGMNSIVVYLLSQLSKGWIKDRLHQHLEPDIFNGPFAPMIESGMVLAVFWLLCWYLYRQRAFLRI